MNNTINKILFDSGDFFMPKHSKDFLDKYVLGSKKSLIYINNWTFIHFISGISIFYILKLYDKNQDNKTLLLNAFVIHTLWELWQIIIGMTPFYTLRGVIDILMDTIVFMLGFYITSQL